MYSLSGAFDYKQNLCTIRQKNTYIKENIHESPDFLESEHSQLMF